MGGPLVEDQKEEVREPITLILNHAPLGVQKHGKRGSIRSRLLTEDDIAEEDAQTQITGAYELNEKQRKEATEVLGEVLTPRKSSIRMGTGKKRKLQETRDMLERMTRPDMVHQCLMSVLDSPLNKSGKLKTYIHTADMKCISVNKEFRIPRNWKLFEKVLVDFLTNPNGALQPEAESKPLLQIVEPPLTKHICPSSTTIVLNSIAEYKSLSEVLSLSITSVRVSNVCRSELVYIFVLVNFVDDVTNCRPSIRL
eukprot:GHVQ01012671.1.p1 GENE.GHVQ01012671.1~~GHVQ01012671.1.p1  ORF type:complete len:254 (-),score=19.24 GHVQ01012671.1:685-1446(-)